MQQQIKRVVVRGHSHKNRTVFIIVVSVRQECVLCILQKSETSRMNILFLCHAFF